MCYRSRLRGREDQWRKKEERVQAKALACATEAGSEEERTSGGRRRNVSRQKLWHVLQKQAQRKRGPVEEEGGTCPGKSFGMCYRSRLRGREDQWRKKEERV